MGKDLSEMKPMSFQSNALERGQHLPSRVASSINSEIRLGHFSAGERLPTENQLAIRFGVSRNVIREAVSQLRADGVVMAKQGVGAFVMAPELRTVIRIDPETLKDSSSMEQFFELRHILEGDAAALAAERRSLEALDRIREAFDRMRGEERWQEGSIIADLAFHSEIALATGNEFISTFINFICEKIRQSIQYARETNPIESLVEVNLTEHSAILDAIARSNPRDARRAMQDHIVGAARRVGITIRGAAHTRDAQDHNGRV
jgi:DNA-binding FadR family transcriptional regulator